MKQLRILLVSIIACVLLVGCNNHKIDKSIEIKEMRDMAQLATMKCYYHYVAKSDKEFNPAWFEFWKDKNMRFWVEYEGIVDIGVDISELKMTLENDIVTIMLPEAKVLDVRVDENSFNEDSFKYDPSTKKPNHEEQIKAFATAKEEMWASAESNFTLLANARENAKKLIENYIKRVEDLTGKTYTIEWVYIENIKD